MYDGKVVLCGANAYEEKYYLNPDFEQLPQEVKDELKIMCVLYVHDVGGILTLVYEEDGELCFEVTSEEFDPMFDDIGSQLKIKELQREKQDLLQAPQRVLVIEAVAAFGHAAGVQQADAVIVAQGALGHAGEAGRFLDLHGIPPVLRRWVRTTDTGYTLTLRQGQGVFRGFLKKFGDKKTPRAKAGNGGPRAAGWDERWFAKRRRAYALIKSDEGLRNAPVRYRFAP